MAYDSPTRSASAARTRSAVLASARASFLDRGWAGTTIRRVAEDAGVSQESVYKIFGGKPGLLKAVHDVEIAGDEEPLTIAQRPEAVAARAAQTPEAAARAYVALVLVLAGRTESLMAVILAARDSDPVLQELADALDAERLRGTGMAVRHWDSRGWIPEVPGATRAVDLVWALNSPTMMTLLGSRGWTIDEYADWLRTAILTQVFGRLPGGGAASTG